MWKAITNDLSPIEQLYYQAIQYQSAWEQFAIPEKPINDDAISSVSQRACSSCATPLTSPSP